MFYEQAFPIASPSCLTRLVSVTRASPFRSRVRRLPEQAAAIAFENNKRQKETGHTRHKTREISTGALTVLTAVARTIELT